MITQGNKRGFTLVELLVVLAIIGLLAVASLPAVSSLSTSFNLTGSTNNVMGTLNYGRQQAIALNAQVEVRFYQYVKAGFPDEPGTGNFHAYQLYEDAPTGVNALTQVQFLPGRIVFSPDTTTLSKLLASGFGTTQVTGTPPAPTGLPATYTYQVFHFRPDGSTDITTGYNFLTLADIISLTSAGAGVAPKNYSTIVIDPISGTAKAIRPGG